MRIKERLAELFPQKWFYRVRGLLVLPPLMLSLLDFRNEVENERLIWSVGLLVFFFGVAVRIWSQSHLRYRLKGHKHFTRTGPYRFVRNPIYIGNTLMCLGVACLSECLWVLPLVLLNCLLVYSLAVRYEERHLLEKYGESYRQYLAEVPRWLPRWTRPKGQPGRAPQLLRAVAVELSCLLLLLPFVLKEVVSRGH